MLYHCGQLPVLLGGGIENESVTRSDEFVGIVVHMGKRFTRVLHSLDYKYQESLRQ